MVIISSPLLMSVQVSMALPHSHGSRASCHHANRDTNLQTHRLGIPAIVAQFSRSLAGKNDLTSTRKAPEGQLLRRNPEAEDTI